MIMGNRAARCPRKDRPAVQRGLALTTTLGHDPNVRGNLSAAFAVLALLAALVGAVYAVLRLRARPGIATAAQRATYEVLHIGALAAQPLQAGLTQAAAGKAIRYL